MQKSILLHSVVLSMLFLAHANELDSNKDLESLLENASELATKKSLNVDYLPSVVTVINAHTYLGAGIQTIGEALDMLPGIQMQLSPTGYTMTTVRGLKNPNAYLSDKIKIMIDGVAINNEVLGSSHFYMDFPMQLVDKIEVLRGPNSTLYGAGAFYGTINIITKLGNNTKENQLFAGAGSYQYRTAGVNLHSSSGDWKLFTDGYYKQNGKALDVKGEVRKTDEAMKDFSVGFKAVNGSFEFLTRLKQNTYGNFYSYEGYLNPIPQRDEDHKNNYFFSQLSYKTALEDYKLEAKASFSHRELDVKNNMGPVGEIAGRFADVNIDMQEGFYTHEKSMEENFEAEALLTLPSMQSNDILMGAGVRQVNITKDEFYSSIENTIIQNMDAILNHPDYNNFRYRESKESAFWANPTTTLLPENTKRTIGYAYLQDLISLTDDVDLVLGLRVDNYSDYGPQWSKRAGLVYRASDTTILKLLYGSAFRAPTLIESYQNGHINTRAGDSTIVPEETDTYEAVAIYMPNLNHKLSLNLFYSKLKNVIDLEEFPNTDPGYQNFKERSSKGVEFEYFFHTSIEHNLYFNATYLDTLYTIPDEPSTRDFGIGSSINSGGGSVNQSMPDISKVMLKAMYVYRPTEALSFGTTWRYFSETTKTELSWVSNDATCDSAHIFDETVTYRFSSSSELRFTAKNLFNREVTLPSYYYSTDGGIVREGRNYFLSYVYNF
ncbi:MAG: TonB-dependent receptor [Sulfuricurvum sp.]|nr:TonB-dependent receptor [Sulfuricurvum sp.]